MEACPQMKYEFVVQRKEEHNFSYHVSKRPKKFKRKMTFEIPKFKLLNRLEQVWRQTGLWEHKPPKICKYFCRF